MEGTGTGKRNVSKCKMGKEGWRAGVSDIG